MHDETRLIYLVEELKKEKLSHFDEFYHSTKKEVFYMCYSIVKDYDEAEDLLQNTFLTFLDKIHRVNTNDSIMGYLLKIARNTSLNYIKRKKKETIIEWDNIVDNKNQHKDLYSLDFVEKIKNLLKPFEFQVVILHVIDELKHQEIAKILKKPLGTITYTYKIAMDKLRRNLDEIRG